MGTAQPMDYENPHLLAYGLANCVIRRGRIQPSRFAIVVNRHNLDTAAFEQSDLVDGIDIAGRNAEFPALPYLHLRPLKPEVADGKRAVIQGVQPARLAEGSFLLETDAAGADRLLIGASNLLGGPR